MLPAEGGKGAAWWGYAVKRRLCTRVSGLVSARRLAVVFDLDETLVLAVTRGASLLRKETILKLRWGTVTGHRPASRAHPCLGDGTGVQQARVRLGCLRCLRGCRVRQPGHALQGRGCGWGARSEPARKRSCA